MSSSTPLIPDFNPAHLLEMTDDTGMLQHAIYATPNRREGYCTDDNARALLLTALIEAEGALDSDLVKAQGCYLAFLVDAFNEDTGRFRNFMSYKRSWLEESGSGDSHGRAVWALGTLISRSGHLSRREVAIRLFKDALPAFIGIDSPRSLAYGILGCGEYLAVFPDDTTVRRFVEVFGKQLGMGYESCSGEKWGWFEDVLSYANARLPQAMMVAGRVLEDNNLFQYGLESLKWLRGVQTDEQGYFAPVGSRSVYKRNGVKSEFDQQPIEAACSVSAYLTAWQQTRSTEWLLESGRAYFWFLGGNRLDISLYDESNGGCFDGLHPTRLNCNQGAESTLSFLCASTEMRSALCNSTPHFTNQISYEFKRLRSSTPPAS